MGIEPKSGNSRTLASFPFTQAIFVAATGAIFVALKLHQVSNMFETPSISRRQIALKIAPGLHVRF